MINLLLSGQHRDAVAEGVASAAAVETVDVLNEMADDRPRVVVRDRVVAVALAWVVEPAPLSSPAGEVKGREGDHRHGRGAAAAEASERRQEDVDDPRVTGTERREHAPVVVAE